MAVQLTEQEAYGISGTIDLLEERIAELELAQEDIGWRQLGGASNNEFSRDGLNRIVARSRIFFLHNPLINRAVSLQCDYVFAQGVNFVATDKEVNKAIQDFIDDVGNIREIAGHQARLMKEQTLMLDGNVFFVLFTDARTGRVQIRSILVDEIVDILCNPDDANDIWYYKREWTATNPLTSKTETQKVLYPDINYSPASKPDVIGGVRVQWNAPIYHVKVGGLGKSRFGVPEVYQALDWANAHRKFLENWATIVSMYARWAFQLKVPGGKNSITAAKQKLGTTLTTSTPESNPPTTAGGIFLSSKEGAELAAVRTQGATTSAQDGREIRMMVAAALGIPDTFFGDVDVGNLATARTLDRPTELKYRSRQQLWTAVFMDILNYVVKWAIIAPSGALKSKGTFKVDPITNQLVFSGDPTTLHIEVKFPPILEHSIIDRINAVVNAVTLNGKTFAVDSPELQQLTLRLLFEALGITDVDEVIKLIFDSIVEPTAPPQIDPNNNNPVQSANNPAQPANVRGS